MKNYEIWCQALKKAWLNNNVIAIINMFDQNATFYETPFDDVIDKKTYWKTWKTLESTKLDKLEYHILCADEDSATVNFIAIKDTNTWDMVYHFKLNKENKCYYLRQWYMTNND